MVFRMHRGALWGLIRLERRREQNLKVFDDILADNVHDVFCRNAKQRGNCGHHDGFQAWLKVATDSERQRPSVLASTKSREDLLSMVQGPQNVLDIIYIVVEVDNWAFLRRLVERS